MNSFNTIVTAVKNLAHLGQRNPQYLESLRPRYPRFTQVSQPGDILNTVAFVSNHYIGHMIISDQLKLIISSSDMLISAKSPNSSKLIINSDISLQLL